MINLIAMHHGLSSTTNIRRITINIEDMGINTLYINPLSTIHDMKDKIQSEVGIPFDEQYLAINGAEVDDQRLVSYYNIDDDSIIHLIIMNNGTHTTFDPPTVPNTTTNNAPNTNTSLSPFYVACRDNDITKLQELLQTLSIDDMNKLEPNESTGLHVACFRGHQEIVKLLLEKGVSRSIMNRFHCLPYQEAASNEIRQLFDLIPEQNRYVANSGQ
ncbi:unnamed protein product, partial [Rotaria sordida]